MSNPTIELLVRSNALACARGYKQTSFINELLSGYVKVVWVPAPWVPLGYALKFGKTGLDTRSWKNLRLRLVQSGFVMVKDTMRGMKHGEYVLILSHPALDKDHFVGVG